MAEQEQRDMIAYFAANLVAIAATQHFDDGRPSKTSLVGGCILDVEDGWFFITAGHCIQELDEAFRTSRVDPCRLIDYVGAQATNLMPVPFDYEHAPRDYVVDDRTGIDFGFIVLHPHYARLLNQNGIMAHNRVNWARQPTDFDVAWMLGIPSSLVQEIDPSLVLFHTSMIPLDLLDSIPAEYLRDSPADLSDLERHARDDQFYARIPHDHVLPQNVQGRDDIRGLSGGPILGFKQQGDATKYWIAAIQSSWYPDARVIRGCPMPFIGEKMWDFVQHAKEYAEAVREGREPRL